MARCLAVLGTGSDVGKSIVTTALCRLFVRSGVMTAPFKAQNMSNNSGVTPEGLEMGRAQIVQAEAAKIVPHVDMNPILLKPTSEVGSQIVLLGEAFENSLASGVHAKKDQLFSVACAALDRLRCDYDLVVIEGAGSCAEVNLMPNDIVNFSMAEYGDAPVLLVADIHKGGVFAQIIGTLECLSKKQKDRVVGFIINRFRGDIGLFEDGVKWIEQRTGKKVFGVLPWYDHITIEAEDSVVIEQPKRVALDDMINPAVAVLRIPHISNFTDFDPLCGINSLDVFFVEKVQDLSMFNAVILPGSKNTRFDLEWLNTKGWAGKLTAYEKQGGKLLGICGGYQMLGRFVHDPDGVEGTPGRTKGLSLLPIETVLKAPKTTTLTRFTWNGIHGTGYEIHMGRTQRLAGESLFHVLERNGMRSQMEEGCRTRDFQIMGTYIHGLFDTPGITKHWLDSIGLGTLEVSNIQGLSARSKEYDLLVDHFEKYVNTKGIVNFFNR